MWRRRERTALHSFMSHFWSLERGDFLILCVCSSDTNQINMSNDCNTVSVLLSTVRAMNMLSHRLKGQRKVPWDTKSHERGSAVMLIFQIELPASPWVLKYCEVYAKKAVSLRHFSIATWSLQPEKNILTVTPQSAKHGKDSGGVLFLILCVQYHAYRRANNTLQGPSYEFTLWKS